MSPHTCCADVRVDVRVPATFLGEASSAGETELDDQPTKVGVREEEHQLGSELPTINGGGDSGGAAGAGDGDGGSSKREPVAGDGDGGAHKRSRLEPCVATTV